MKKSILAILLATALVGCASQPLIQTSSKTQEHKEQETAENLFNKAMAYYNQADYSKAFTLFQKAANQGVALAQYNLGLMYYNGRGVIQDDKQAVYWYQKAANQGDASAQLNLGVMYANGRGVIQDDKQAEMWGLLAKYNGNNNVTKLLSFVENKLSHSQIEQAQDMARQCLSSKYTQCY